MRFNLVLVLSLIAPMAPITSARAQASTAPAAWGPLERLLGVWVADSGSGGEPGRAVRGGETWSRDLDGRVLIRRDYSEYPATATRAAFRHDGLTIIAPAPDGGFTAHFYDTEGHMIEYAVVASDSAVVFVSRPIPSAPQFRLAYRPIGGRFVETFEIAAPGQPGAFHPYVTGGLHRAP